MANGRRILVVDDEDDLAEVVCFNLEREGFRCQRAADATQALRHLKTAPPDLVVLDRMLPDKPGDVVAREIRRNPDTASIPILMLTARADEQAELSGFACGADDYVSKPFSMSVLVARVDSLLRRSADKATDSHVVEIGPIRVDPDRHETIANGVPVALTAMEFDILRALMNGGGRVLDRDGIINAVLGPTVAVTDRTIDVHVAALRKKLGSASSWVQTIRGVGYTFRTPAAADS